MTASTSGIANIAYAYGKNIVSQQQNTVTLHTSFLFLSGVLCFSGFGWGVVCWLQPAGMSPAAFTAYLAAFQLNSLTAAVCPSEGVPWAGAGADAPFPDPFSGAVTLLLAVVKGLMKPSEISRPHKL
jgi:hypothetical protein